MGRQESFVVLLEIGKTLNKAEDLANNLYEHCIKEYDLNTINKIRLEGLV